MAKKISEVIIKVSGKGLKATNTELKKLLADVDKLTTAAEALDRAFDEGGRSDAILTRMATAAERTEKEMQELGATSKKSLSVMEELFQQTAFATEEAGDAAGRLENKLGGLRGKGKGVNNVLKDTNRQGANSVRTFSKMARSAGGLTVIYAAVAANVFALSEAFRIMNESASVQRLSDIAGVMSNEMGISIAGTARALQEATDSAVSYQEALRLASASAAFGFDTEQMEKLALVAKRASIVLGVDMQDALNRVTRGIAKQEVELLDELGLTVRLNEAFAEYAATHGIAAKSLTSFQRQQALTNMVIKKSDQNLGAVDSKLQSTSWEKFGAEVSTAANQLLRAISTSETMTSMLDSMTEGLAKLRKDYTNFKLQLAGGNKDKQIELIDSPGIDQFNAAYGKGTDIFKGMLGAQVSIRKELDNTAATMKSLVDSGEHFNSSTGKVTRQYAALDKRGQLLREHLTLAQALTQQTDTGAKGVLDTFRSLTKSGQDFTNSLKVADNEITGTAVQTLDPLLKDIETAKASLERSRGVAGGLGSGGRTDLAAAGIDEKDVDRAKQLAEYQRIGVQHTTKILSIESSSLRESEKELALVSASLDTESSRLQVLKTLGAEDSKMLERLLARKGAEEKIRSIKEAELLLQQGISQATEEFDMRNKDSITQARVSVSIAERQLSAAIASGVASEDTIRNLEAEVVVRKRNLKSAKELSAEQEKQAHFSIANDLAGNIGGLDSGMGQFASGLISMADGWDKLGDSAASSAEKIKAASQVAGGFQSALGGLISAASGMVASGIDAEIAAVKSMGLTQEQEDKKVTKLQKKKIKEQEKYTKASILMNTAMGVARSLGELPFPANFVVAGITAAAGAMAYQQASNTAASQLASLGGGSTSAESMKISVGSSSSMSTDVSSAATAGERGQMLGDSGIYGRASAGSMRANTPYITSESGRELIIPKTDSKIMNATDTEAILSGGSGNTFAPSIHIDALDSQSVEDRIPEIMSMLQEHAEQQGFSMRN